MLPVALNLGQPNNRTWRYTNGMRTWVAKLECTGDGDFVVSQYRYLTMDACCCCISTKIAFSHPTGLETPVGINITVIYSNKRSGKNCERKRICKTVGHKEQFQFSIGISFWRIVPSSHVHDVGLCQNQFCRSGSGTNFQRISDLVSGEILKGRLSFAFHVLYRIRGSAMKKKTFESGINIQNQQHWTRIIIFLKEGKY
jgi:hypothetical protein